MRKYRSFSDTGYFTPVTPPSGAGDPTFSHIWYLKDHLGNNRVLLDASGKVYAVHHYDPFGGEISVASLLNVTQFPTSNETTSSYDFEARQMAPSFHRFTTMDPLAEKYYGISPYAYCAGNPVNLVDPEGMVNWPAILKGSLAILVGVGSLIGGVAISGGTSGAAAPILQKKRPKQ